MSLHLHLIRKLLFAGCDFNNDDAVDVNSQVDLLIKQATSHENLCQCYIGWYVHKFVTLILFLPKPVNLFPQCSWFL